MVRIHSSSINGKLFDADFLRQTHIRTNSQKVRCDYLIYSTLMNDNGNVNGSIYILIYIQNPRANKCHREHNTNTIRLVLNDGVCVEPFVVGRCHSICTFDWYVYIVQIHLLSTFSGSLYLSCLVVVVFRIAYLHSYLKCGIYRKCPFCWIK